VEKVPVLQLVEADRSAADEVVVTGKRMNVYANDWRVASCG